MALEDRWASLSDEMKAKVKGAKSSEEMVALIQDEGYDLTSEELEAIAGGDDGWTTCFTFDCEEDAWRGVS